MNDREFIVSNLLDAEKAYGEAENDHNRQYWIGQIAKLVALMDQYGVINLRQIPQREAEAFLNKLKGENADE